MLNIAAQLFPLLAAIVAVFFIGRTTGRSKAPQVKDELKLRLQKSERSTRPIKTALTQTENEAATRRHAVATLQNKFKALQTCALNKEQTEIARLLSKFAGSEGTPTRLSCESAEDDIELTRIANALTQREVEINQFDLSLTKAQGAQSALDQRLAEMKTRLNANQTAAKRARTEGAMLQREINNLQLRLNDATNQETKPSQSSEPEERDSRETGVTIKSDLEQSISTLKDNLNNKIADTKTANNQREILSADMTALEEQVHTLDSDVESLQQELQSSRKHYQNSTSALRKTLTEKEAKFSDGGTTNKQLADLQRTHKQLQTEHINALKHADRRVTDLTRELDLSEIKIQIARDKAAATARASKANLTRQIAVLKKQLGSSDSDLNISDQVAVNRKDAERQQEIAELKSKLKELNKLLAETITDKKALQKQLELTDDSEQPLTTISDSLGITESTDNDKTAKSATRRKKKKAS